MWDFKFRIKNARWTSIIPRLFWGDQFRQCTTALPGHVYTCSVDYFSKFEDMQRITFFKLKNIFQKWKPNPFEIVSTICTIRLLLQIYITFIPKICFPDFHTKISYFRRNCFVDSGTLGAR